MLRVTLVMTATDLRQDLPQPCLKASDTNLQLTDNLSFDLKTFDTSWITLGDYTPHSQVYETFDAGCGMIRILLRRPNVFLFELRAK